MKRHQRVIAILTAIVLVLTIVPMSAFAESSAAKKFTDIKDGIWYSSYGNYVYEHGYMSGTGGGKFSPKGTTTRAMFVTVLARIAKVL